MKIITLKEICKKTTIAFLTFILLFQFMMPIRSEADFEMPDADDVFSAMAQILAAGGDLVMGAFNNFMLGTKGFGTAMISNEALGKGSWFDPVDKDGNTVTASEPSNIDEMSIGQDDSGKNIVVFVENGTLDEDAILTGSDTWEVPNLLYCPENIFGNNIALLDVNFLNPNKYSSVVTSGRGVETAEEKNGRDSSVANELKGTIAGWYKAFRNIAVVALLSILVYLGIRILISSTAEDKAKYKEIIKDWLIAMVLVFAMHFIMSFTIMLVNQINALFIDANNNVFVSYGGQLFKSNFTGVIRFLAQSQDGWNAWAYTIIYIVLVAYTVSFTFQYLRRVLYIAFYTMIAPLVAITYPLDKLGDGKSQAFNKWLKEYVMTMALQPIHLIIYTMIVSSALTLSIKSPLYAIVAIGFLIPAEQFIKSLFGVESKADGGFAAGAATTALAMSALGKMKKPVLPPNLRGGNKGGKGGDLADTEEKTPKIRQSGNKELDSFNRTNIKNEDKAMLDEDDNSLFGNNDRNQSRAPIYLTGDNEDKEQNIEAFDYQGKDWKLPFGNKEPETYSNEYLNDDSSLLDDYAMADNIEDNEEPEIETFDIPDNYNNMLGDEELPEGLDDNNLDVPEVEPQYTQRIRTEEPSGLDEEERNKAIIKAVNKKYRGRMRKAAGFPGVKSLAGGVLKGVGKGAKLALKGTGGVIGAGAGLGIGIASGKGVQGAMQGLGIGAAAGMGLGTSAYNLGAGAVRGAYNVGKADVERRKAINNVRREREIEAIEATQGVEAANRYARNNLTRAERRRYNELLREYQIATGQNLTENRSKKQIEELYKDIYDYESHGVSDTKKIIKGLQLEHDDKYKQLREDTGLDRSADKHDNIVDVMRMTQSFGADYVTDAKKNEQFNKTVDLKVKNKQDREKVKDLFWAANGFNHKDRPVEMPAQTQNSTAKTTKAAKAGTTRTRKTTTKKPTNTDNLDTMELDISKIKGTDWKKPTE